ncbi:MAG TPA: hypothetical protein VD931_23495 [Baekduia sp.]|nr:hypothetical protein [Baekduia sp.]
MTIKTFVAATLSGAALLASAASATAAGPADVTVRVEDDAATVLPRTALRTTTTPVVKDGTHACSGTSAAGALERATGGAWSGAWSDGFGSYSVDTIKGVAHPFGSGAYWAFYVDDIAQGTGVCGRELTNGEEVLFVAQSESGPSKGILRLRGLQARVTPGQSVTVQVVRTTTQFASDPPYAATPKTEPAAGATISGPGIALTADAQGRASFVASSKGEQSLRATRSGDVASATEGFCVTDGTDGLCGTVKPCVTSGSDGLCGTPDRAVPVADIASIADGQRFAAGKGPRELRGTLLGTEPSGLQRVSIRLTRNDRGRCSRFDGRRLAFVRTKRCSARSGTWTAVGEAADWRYLLPGRLARGRYVLDVGVRDRAGNATRQLLRDRNRVVFHVG